MTLGETIKGLRGKAKMTQAQLAELSGVPQSYICRLEKGHGDGWDVYRIESLAGVFGLSLNEVMDLARSEVAA